MMGKEGPSPPHSVSTGENQGTDRKTLFHLSSSALVLLYILLAYLSFCLVPASIF
jgi:hypothetical protein